eukprot:6050-Heterococcus_DN1.PRE.8
MYFLLLRSLAPDPQEQPQLSPSRHALALVAGSPTPLLKPHSTSDNTSTTAVTTAANTIASASGDADTVTASASQQQQRQQQLRDCVRPFWDSEHSGALLQPALDLDGRGRSWCKRFSTKAAAGAGEADMTAGTFGVTIRALPGDFHKTRVVTFFPRYIVTNSLPCAITVLPCLEHHANSHHHMQSSGSSGSIAAARAAAAAGDIRGSTGVTVAQFLAASRAGPGSAIHSLSDGSGGLTAPRLPSNCSSTVYDFPVAGVGQQSSGSKPERCVRFAVAKDQIMTDSLECAVTPPRLRWHEGCSCARPLQYVSTAQASYLRVQIRVLQRVSDTDAEHSHALLRESTCASSSKPYITLTRRNLRQGCLSSPLCQPDMVYTACCTSDLATDAHMRAHMPADSTAVHQLRCTQLL